MLLGLRPNVFQHPCIHRRELALGGHVLDHGQSLTPVILVARQLREFREALDIALAMEAAGQLSPADAFIPDYLRRKIG